MQQKLLVGPAPVHLLCTYSLVPKSSKCFGSHMDLILSDTASGRCLLQYKEGKTVSLSLSWWGLHQEFLLRAETTSLGNENDTGQDKRPSGLALHLPSSSHTSASLMVAMTIVTKPVWDCSWVLIEVRLILLPSHCWKSNGQLHSLPNMLHLQPAFFSHY